MKRHYFKVSRFGTLASEFEYWEQRTENNMRWYSELRRGLTERIPGTTLVIRPGAMPEGVKLQIVREPSAFRPDGSIACAGEHNCYKVSMEDETLPYKVRFYDKAYPAPIYKQWRTWSQTDLDQWVSEKLEWCLTNRRYWTRMGENGL